MHIALKELNNALADLEKLAETDPRAHSDLLVLGALKSTSSGATLEGYADAIAALNSLLKKDLEGVVFKRADMLFYKGVFLALCGDYKKAKLMVQESYQIKQAAQEQRGTRSNRSAQELSKLLDSSFSDAPDCGRLETRPRPLEEWDFTDRTYNVYEYLYNLAVLELAADARQPALELLATLLDSVPDEAVRDGVQRLIAHVRGPPDPTALRDFTPFPHHNRLCSIYPALRVRAGTCRLSFCLPQVEMASLACAFDSALLDIGPTVVENRPEAPWIKRSAEGVIFTDNIQYIDDLDLMSEKRETGTCAYCAYTHPYSARQAPRAPRS